MSSPHRQWLLLGLCVVLVAVAGGFFVVGANQDRGTTVNGAVYRRTPEGFERVLFHGAGSEIDTLIRSAGVARAA